MIKNGYLLRDCNKELDDVYIIMQYIICLLKELQLLSLQFYIRCRVSATKGRQVALISAMEENL